MKKYILSTMLALYACISATAQHVSAEFTNTSMPEALLKIESLCKDISINFIYDDLKDFRVTQSIHNLQPKEAIHAVIGEYPVRVVKKNNKFYITIVSAPKVAIYGQVQDGFLHRAVPNVKVSLTRADSTVINDSLNLVVFMTGNDTQKYHLYSDTIKAQDKEYMIHAVAKGYADTWQKVRIADQKNGELEVPMLDMRKVIELPDVEVVATKIKMFWKGDTLVYDATAFKLPEGSMLDALIAQLPGVELRDNGEIFVNGRKVDELLLASHSFMRGNKKILMENLPYYTVKDIKVYDKQSDKSKALGYDVDPRSYVMDVNLKQEYQRGYIANVEGAIGTEDRWLARGFALGFTDYTRWSIFGNVNNVNESRHIGQSDHWTPATMPSSMLTTRSIATELFYHPRSDKFRNTFNADYSSTSNVSDMHQRYQQFLSGSNPMSVSTSRNRSGNKQIDVHDEFGLNKPFWLLVDAEFKYATRDGSFNSSFDQWSDTLTASNRAAGMSEGKMWYLMGEAQGAFNINKEKQIRMDFYAKLDHTTDKSQSANSYDTRQYVSPSSQTTHNTDDIYNRNTWGIGIVGTNIGIGNDVSIRPGFTSYFIDNHTRDYLYHPDSLLLPSEMDMLTAITDPQNSYDSHSTIVENKAGVSLFKSGAYGGGGLKIGYTKWSIGLDLPIRHSRLDYQRGAIDTLATQNTMFLNISGNRRIVLQNRKHDIRMDAGISRGDIDLINLLAWHDDSQPLIVRTGNPDLKGDITTKANVNYYYNDPKNYQHTFHIGTSLNYFNRSVAQSVVYNPENGVYTYKPMNVKGAYTLRGTFDLNNTLDEKKYWTIQTNADANLHHSVDHAMLEGMTESEENIVNTLTLHDGAYIQYNKDKLNIRATGDIRWRHSEGRMRDFETLNAFDYQYGLSGRYTFSGINLTLSADANMFSRRGYGSSALNTDDFVVNASLSQPLFKGKLIARLEAFDIFHNLSSTQYEVNAQGRTETWYRSLPHYVMFHLVYHWNKNPKKK